ncbi:guanylate kinase [Facklamia sp. HMSC062C11]|uniref:Guanylate kinase n=1 Tax=Facklamia hominis TaxID=178214 RepID=A0AAJ1Q7F9_9LACT|nr:MULTISPECIES: guanylate kinase [Facklamia]EPH12968.1 guanylate kinase [Facklamia hominis ACS-120-V-Sch10]MDK7188109.1 guanylate kinase [Facklamia hominis]OFL68170.1 guanylate kinase [Facklamia sp. HMSC062C11]PKY92789.1 guanylate kinase [Facklamia hominis]WPJ90008.1 guanylate kinase [Facklamia hominis]
MTKQRGLLVILSGPSGVGKGTVRAAVFKQEDCEYVYSVSATTRSARPGEIDGKDYFFVKREEFESLIANQALLEYAEYVGNYYGTPLDNIEKNLAEGYDVFLEIEVQGASKVRQRMPEGIFIFLAPPSLNELETRLVDRGTDSKEKIAQRMKQAKREIEMMAEYDYVVVNDQVDNAVRKINAIIECEHLRVSRVIDKIQIGMDQYLNNKGE